MGGRALTLVGINLGTLCDWDGFMDFWGFIIIKYIKALSLA